MACSCTKRKKFEYVWNPPEDSALSSITYSTEIEAKARVMRSGGSYTSVIKAS